MKTTVQVASFMMLFLVVLVSARPYDGEDFQDFLDDLMIDNLASLSGSGSGDLKVQTRPRRSPDPCVARHEWHYNECLGESVREAVCKASSQIRCGVKTYGYPKCLEVHESRKSSNGSHCRVLTKCECAD